LLPATPTRARPTALMLQEALTGAGFAAGRFARR
jgi:hypothetical protein